MKRRKFIQQSSAAGLAFSFMPLACAEPAPKLDAEILILGGGLSGLYLAYLLDKAGKDYLVLEGSNRIGGRMFSREDIGREVGGRGIGDKYSEVMKLVKEFNTEMIDITDYMRSPSAIYLEGKLYDKWPDPKTNPAYLQFSAFGKSPQLTALNQWYQKPELDETYSELLKRNGLSEEQIDLANISANYNDIRETSAINAYHSSAFRKFNGSERVLNFKGGSHHFINAIANSLKNPVLTDKMVNTIDDNGKEVVVKCADDSIYRAKKVVSTMPFTTLRDVKMNTSFNGNQKRAINELDYTDITQIHLQHTEPFWEQDEMPFDMWTDTPLERIMNMSSSPTEKELACWVNGLGTAFFDKMSEKEVADYTIKKINEIRPSTVGKIEYLGQQNWGKYKYNKGAYVEFGVGQAAWFEDMIKPAGNMHFAGEHTAHESRGMEAAAESARRVYNELMT
ncbi:FAD-dependent oxidoreductase [Maribacter algarum]|uniref:Tryptophan 2-monooxygenase n=1 Tax=Maribacter algarum (ex Zhang et al. 2020) TaxID=2578118 RepID=A0A5S3PUL2_9FLAO|nr:NAD(P)/FAD-dependent oxidoreductase [Maribacter algarum]TMM58630.1 FAD-dependent oxidoreductase [Maribacter algarum]